MVKNSIANKTIGVPTTKQFQCFYSGKKRLSEHSTSEFFFRGRGKGAGGKGGVENNYHDECFDTRTRTRTHARSRRNGIGAILQITAARRLPGYFRREFYFRRWRSSHFLLEHTHAHGELTKRGLCTPVMSKFRAGSMVICIIYPGGQLANYEIVSNKSGRSILTGWFVY